MLIQINPNQKFVENIGVGMVKMGAAILVTGL